MMMQAMESDSPKKRLAQETGWKWHRWAVLILLLVLFVVTPASGPHYGHIRNPKVNEMAPTDQVIPVDTSSVHQKDSMSMKEESGSLVETPRPLSLQATNAPSSTLKEQDEKPASTNPSQIIESDELKTKKDDKSSESRQSATSNTTETPAVTENIQEKNPNLIEASPRTGKDTKAEMDTDEIENAQQDDDSYEPSEFGRPLSSDADKATPLSATLPSKLRDRVPILARNETGKRYVKKKMPLLIWLLSFPNSGTTYTLKFVQNTTNTTTATYYGAEQARYSTSVPINSDYEDGPFLRFPNQTYSKYVLTKTHCGGYCVRCSPERYALSTKAFEKECRTGNKIDGRDYASVKPVDNLSPKKAVHIFRNPFDNVVARLHMQRKNWKTHGNRKNHLIAFEDSRVGFRRWCNFMDTTTANEMDSPLLDEEVRRLYKLVPCHAEFFRWAHWHKRAMQMVKDELKIPVHNLFYENYTLNYDHTVEELLDYIELPAVNDPPAFIPGKVYPDYFKEEEKRDAARLVRHVATDELWPLIQHYFEDIPTDTNK